MLVLTRKVNERILLTIPEGWHGEILLNVCEIAIPLEDPNGRKRVKIGVIAPREVLAQREEIAREPIPLVLKGKAVVTPMVTHGV